MSMKNLDRVRVAKNENIIGKQINGRFIQKEKVFEKCHEKVYQIKYKGR